jgi:hypothetical protein
MSLQFKLVGFNNMNSKVLEFKVPKKSNDLLSFNIKDIFEYVFNLAKEGIENETDIEELKKDFESHFEETKLIYDSHPIKDFDKEYIVSEDKFMSLYVFTSNLVIREKYKIIFDKFGVSNDSSNNSNLKNLKKNDEKLDEKYEEKLIDEDDVLSDEDIINANSDIVKLFMENSELIVLIKILRSKPHLFDYLSQYVTCGDIIDKEEYNNLKSDSDNKLKNESNLNNDQDDKLTNFKYTDSYNKIVEILKLINIEVNELELKKLLIKNNGFINIPLRYILYNSCNDKI